MCAISIFRRIRFRICGFESNQKIEADQIRQNNQRVIHCPDICPMTMAKLAGMYQDLVKLTPEPLEIWFVSVDPKRDTPEQLAQYISYFNQAPMKARTAKHKDLFPFIRQLGLMYAINEGTEDRYTVDHSASLALPNPQGAVVAMFKPEMKPGAVPLINNQQFLADYPLVIAAAAE
ncbi:SCO family protein [Rheinheimera sp. A13L]|uniref:SCO family protein n=1 Tax=Rheinheimera sp. A13L TaxID=506534 RepID=UPI002351D7A2|nr:SCO family protein [Rheinheimera sp. A13L]